jgi:hypothetical protein
MHVEVVESPIERRTGVEAFSDVAVERAVKNFLAAVSSDDSLFVAENSRASLGDDLSSRQKTCAAILSIKFRDEKQASSRSLHFSLLQKLSELLKAAGSAESLGAILCLVPANNEESTTSALALWMRLEAKGSSPDQAALRWGLGLAHVQQALLFLSRYLRQQMGQSGD